MITKANTLKKFLLKFIVSWKVHVINVRRILNAETNYVTLIFIFKSVS